MGSIALWIYLLLAHLCLDLYSRRPQLYIIRIYSRSNSKNCVVRSATLGQFATRADRVDRRPHTGRHKSQRSFSSSCLAVVVCHHGETITIIIHILCPIPIIAL